MLLDSTRISTEPNSFHQSLPSPQERQKQRLLLAHLRTPLRGQWNINNIVTGDGRREWFWLNFFEVDRRTVNNQCSTASKFKKTPSSHEAYPAEELKDSDSGISPQSEISNDGGRNTHYDRWLSVSQKEYITSHISKKCS